MLVAFINDAGKVIDVKELHLEVGSNYGKMGDIAYDQGEPKKIIGAMLYTPNGCCWVKTPNGWRCVTCP